MGYRLQRLFIALVDGVMALIAFVLGMRVIFQLIEANPSTPFVGFINRVSAFLMYPFQGMFPELQIAEIGALDVVALISLLAYSIVGYLIIMAIRSFHPAVHDEYRHERHVLH